MKKNLKHVSLFMLILITFTFILFFSISLISCESPSAKAHHLKMQERSKVVVIDRVPISNTNTIANLYKIQIIDKGVVGYLKSAHVYEKNDTLLVATVSIQYQ